MIYYDWSLRVRTGRNLSVRVDRSTEVAGWHTLPDASNYMCVSVRGPFELCPLWKQQAAPEHARPAAVWMSPGARLQPRGAFYTHPTASPCKQNCCDAVNLQKLKCNLCQRRNGSWILNDRNVREAFKISFKIIFSFQIVTLFLVYRWRKWGSVWWKAQVLGQSMDEVDSGSVPPKSSSLSWNDHTSPQWNEHLVFYMWLHYFSEY